MSESHRISVDLASKALVVKEQPPSFFRKLDEAGSHWFIDFGKTAFGRVRLRTHNAGNGTALKIHLGEILTSDGKHIDRNPGYARRYRCVSLSPGPGTHWHETEILPDERNTLPCAIAMPTEVGEVMPFRYCEIEGLNGELHQDDIRRVCVHYPFNDDAARFRSSSKCLNDLWDLCQYSIKATSFTGIYIDGDRERIPYEGDAYINQISHYCLDTEYAMARRTLEFLLTHPTWPIEWHQHIPLMVWEEVLYTGQTDFLRQHYDEIRRKLLLTLAREDGLLVSDERVGQDPALAATVTLERIRPLIDWPVGERDGHCITDVDSVVNAFHYRGLTLMASMAEIIGKKGDASTLKARAAQVWHAYQSAFYDERNGCYRDGENVAHASLHANMFALAFGLVPLDKQPEVARFVRSRGMACSVYGAQHLLDGLYQTGEDRYALQLLTSREERSWGHMLYDLNATITLEAWDNRFKPNQDWNHAWGAAPANIIPRRLMGIMPTKPGFSHVKIHPRIAHLEYAEIQHPTPHGPIQLQIAQTPDQMKVSLECPQSTRACYIQPNGRAITLSGGTHEFTHSRPGGPA